MTDALTLIREIRSGLSRTDEKILRHPYLDALERGELSAASLKGFAGELYHILASELRSVSNLVGRHGHLTSRVFLMNVLQGESAAMDALLDFASRLDLSEARLAAHEPSPEAQTYGHFVAWLGAFGSDAELAAALLGGSETWAANCGRMGRALTTGFGFDDEACAFFHLFSHAPALEDAALPVIQAGLDRGIHPRLMLRSARLLQAYQLMFWNGMAAAERGARAAA